MKVVAGLVIIAMIVLVLFRWVLKLGALGFLMIGITACVPVGMACVLNLHGRMRLWAILPAALLVVFSALIFYVWNRQMK